MARNPGSRSDKLKCTFRFLAIFCLASASLVTLCRGLYDCGFVPRHGVVVRSSRSLAGETGRDLCGRHFRARRTQPQRTAPEWRPPPLASSFFEKIGIPSSASSYGNAVCLRQASLSQRILAPFAGRGQGGRIAPVGVGHARPLLRADDCHGALCQVRVVLRRYPAQVERQFRHLSADHLDLRRIELA